jgi:hypothetical protein
MNCLLLAGIFSAVSGDEAAPFGDTTAASGTETAVVRFDYAVR